MKNNVQLFIILIMLCISTAKGLSQSKLLENCWLTQDKEAKIKFYKINNNVYGRIVWLKTPLDKQGNPVKDTKNPDLLKKERGLMKLEILKKLKFDGKEWVNGVLYDPSDGETYKCKMWLEGENTLKVRGYLGFLYETETWTKVKY